ncbi:MAG: hypothetical protein WA814_00075 [Candidatus Baltobacteraceae bacterium]
MLVAEHAPELCPTSNAKIREMLRQGSKEIPSIAAKNGVKIGSINVLGPDHKMIAVLEADDIEKVRNFAMESRLVQWNVVNIHPAWSMEETIEKADRLPPIF